MRTLDQIHSDLTKINKEYIGIRSLIDATSKTDCVLLNKEADIVNRMVELNAEYACITELGE